MFNSNAIFEADYRGHFFNKVPPVQTLIVILAIGLPVFKCVPITKQTGLIWALLLLGYFCISLITLIKAGVVTALQYHYFETKQTLNPQKPSLFPLLLVGLYLIGCYVLIAIHILNQL